VQKLLVQVQLSAYSLTACGHLTPYSHLFT